MTTNANDGDDETWEKLKLDGIERADDTVPATCHRHAIETRVILACTGASGKVSSDTTFTGVDGSTVLDSTSRLVRLENDTERQHSVETVTLVSNTELNGMKWLLKS